LLATRDAHELSGQRRPTPDGGIDAARQRVEVEIDSADDDTGVSGIRVMQPDEVPPVQGHSRTAVRGGKLEHGAISQCMPGFPPIGDGDDIVPEATERLDHWPRQVLVGKQAGHRLLRGFVVADIPVDLVAMGADVRPGLYEVLGTERRVGVQEGSLGGTQAPRLFQQPNGNPRTDDGRLAAADIRQRVDARKGLTQFPGDTLKQLRLLAWCQSRQPRVRFGLSSHDLP
jgi:hypothetical protein